MFHVKKAALLGTALPLGVVLEKKDGDIADLMKQVNAKIADIGKDFEEFKSTNDQRWKEIGKKSSADGLLEEKVTKIGDNLDKLVEAKAALEKRIDAEKKEREDLELRLSRPGNGGTEAEQKAAASLKELNEHLSGAAAERKRTFTPLDQKGYDDYRNGLKSWIRHGEASENFDKKTMLVGSDPQGGYWVTPDIGGRIVTKVYETSEIRAIASVQTIGTDALEGIEDLGEAGAGYADELTEGSDTTTPEIGKWRIPVYWIATQPKATQQLLDDANVDVEAWLAGKVANKFGRFENSEFCVGAAKIRGLTSYTTAADSGSGVTWGTIGHIATANNGDFPASTPADKLFDLVGLVKQEYLANSRWLTRRSVITKIRKFKESTTNAYIWQPGLQVGVPEMLLGYPVTRAEDMPALATDSLSMMFGDFRAGYQIVDRAGIRVLRDELTSKPYVKFYTRKRTGGAVINFEAIKAMKFGS